MSLLLLTEPEFRSGLNVERIPDGPAEPGSALAPRSPPRPSPGSLHYSDEDVSSKYNDLIPAESSSLTEKPSEISDSQVRSRLPPPSPLS